MINVDERISQVVNFLKESLAPQKVILFGSRATGNATKGSDIDIAVAGAPKPSIREERRLKERLDEIAGLLSVDLIFLDDLGDEDMKSVILETGVVKYEKK